MENYTYLDVYAKTYLNEIKRKIKQNNIALSGEKEKETDEYMVDIIKSLCIKPRNNLDDKEKFILKILPTDSKEDTERIVITLMLYYTAVYNENMELLNRLLEEGFNFGYSSHELDLYILDKRISSQFNMNLYIELIKNQTSMFKQFYISIQNDRPAYKSKNSDAPVTELSTDEAIEKFVNILKQNPNVALSSKKNTYYQSNPYEIRYLFSKNSINYFNEDIILNATEEQKLNIISQVYHTYLTKQSVARLTDLMMDGNFSTDIYAYWNEVLEELSDYELTKINELNKDIFKDARLYIERKLYFDNKADIKDTPELYIKKVRELLNQQLKPSQKQELVEQKPKKKILQILKKQH